MKAFVISSALLVASVSAQQGAWQQCGGIGWTGGTTCVSGYTCTVGNPYYSQCLPGSAPPPPPPASSSQGGGGGGGGSSVTVVTFTTWSTSIYTVCGGQTTTTPPPPPPPPTTTSTTSSPSASATTNPSGKTKYAGINIAGFDFGCTTDGSCNLVDTDPPLSSLGGPDGAGQMQHFVRDDHLNIFRLPVAWQYLVNNNLGGNLDPTNSGKYDQLVQACLATGASCIVDIHNYARWNGGIIGQGGPTNAQFASLWTQLANKYKNSPNVIFGLMNEPHDLDINTWAATVQAVVTAIRGTGATNMILLPGTQYTAAGAFVSDGSAAALAAVKNPDGSTTGLVFDVHQYLDSDNSGTHADCVTNNISGWSGLAAWLRQNGRQALNTETGGGNTSSCETYLCQEIAYLNANSDVFLGYVTWAAGSFLPTYTLTETPTNNGGSWTDQPLVSTCIKR